MAKNIVQFREKWCGDIVKSIFSDSYRKTNQLSSENFKKLQIYLLVPIYLI